MGTEASATVAQSAIQIRIDAQQTLDAIEYGIRSIELSRDPYGASDIHSAQIAAGCQAATRVLGRAFVAQDNGTLMLLKIARRQQREIVKAITADVKAIGTARQLRLALAA